ncbi:MAG: hypothetical protein ABW061_07335 [Polyangiaceae bacterium]
MSVPNAAGESSGSVAGGAEIGVGIGGGSGGSGRGNAGREPFDTSTAGSGHGSSGATGAAGGSGPVGAAGAGGAGAAASGSGGAPGLCPALAPAVGATCAPEYLACSWGDSGLPECRTFLVCIQGQWANGTLRGVLNTEGGIGSVCHSPPAGACPDASPAGEDCPAALHGTRCQYSAGSLGTLCTCLASYCADGNCAPLPESYWQCSQLTGPCPEAVPNAGTPCNIPTFACMYDVDSLAVWCIDGFWKWQVYDP